MFLRDTGDKSERYISKIVERFLNKCEGFWNYFGINE